MEDVSSPPMFSNTSEVTTQQSMPESMMHPRDPLMQDRIGNESMKQGGGQMMMPDDDPDNPQNWHIVKKLYVSSVAFWASFVVAFGLTAYTVGIPLIMEQFNISLTASIGGFSLFLFGVVFTPILVPHYTEALGRSNVYLVLLPLFSLFTLGAGASRNYASLAVCRFFAGFFGGPCLVLIEGTFADVWSANATAAYYGILTLGSFIGAACGPLVLGFIVPHTSWRWTQWVPIMLAFVVFFFAVGMPQTDPRAVMRRRARRTGVPHNLPPPATGVGLREKMIVTFFRPFKMGFTNPLVAGISLYLGFCFAVLFASFVFIPPVFKMTYKFTPQKTGLLFLSPIGGSVMSAVSTVLFDRAIFFTKGAASLTVEHRLLPAMLGGVLITASLWWVANTTAPTFPERVPIVAIGFFVWGVMSVVTSGVTYLFDAFPPRIGLGALASAGIARLSLAGFLPLVIIQMITNLGGKWALQVYAIIAIPLMFLPYLGFFFGERLRARSKYNREDGLSEKPMQFTSMSDSA